MAHSPEVKAKCVALIRTGATYGDIERVTGVKPSVLSRWAKEITEQPKRKRNKTEENGIVPEYEIPITESAREDRFESAVEGFLLAAMKMLTTWADEASNREFIRSNPAGVIELGKIVCNRAEKIVSRAMEGEPEQDSETDE